jgi:8-hydroxy-5-deazaflavin:NADPH oxidoreductase
VISLAASLGLARVTVAEAMATARVVVVADPLDSIEVLFDGLTPERSRAVVIDASPGCYPMAGDLAGRMISALRACTGGASVYRAFNTVPWPNSIGWIDEAEVPDVFYAGPEDDTREVVEGLVGALGLRPVYVGGYDAIELVDSIAALHTAVARHRPGREIAVKLLEREI